MENFDKKIISFIIWENKPEQVVGALANAIYAAEVYPDWICRFYATKSLDKESVKRLGEMAHVEVVPIDTHPTDYKNTLYRFLPAGEPDVNVMISRDVESRISYREKYAVDEWLESDRMFHVMHDHPNFAGYVLPGCWGVKNKTLVGIGSLIRYYLQSVVNRPWEGIAALDEGSIIYRKGVDRNFLETVVYPMIDVTCMRHDNHNRNAFGNLIGKRFPTRRESGEGYVGEIFDIEDNPINPEWRQLLDYADYESPNPHYHEAKRMEEIVRNFPIDY